jgi:hypothetical protein
MPLLSRFALCAALLGVALAQSPRERELMLPSAVRLSGVVTDSGGRPLSDVWVLHAGNEVRNMTTDSQGRFDIRTRAPAVVFRKPGFQSQYLRVGGDREVAISLAGPAAPMKECEAPSKLVSLGGGSVFCLPRIPGVHVGEVGVDTDYAYRWFWFRTHPGKVGIEHAEGATWGTGLPFDEDVWSARDYAETAFHGPKGLFIVDARGKSSDGKCWRILGRFSESANYRDVPERYAALLDRVLDGACVDATQIKYPR